MNTRAKILAEAKELLSLFRYQNFTWMAKDQDGGWYAYYLKPKLDKKAHRWISADITCNKIAIRTGLRKGYSISLILISDLVDIQVKAENRHIIELKKFIEDVKSSTHDVLDKYKWAAKDASSAWYLYSTKPTFSRCNLNWIDSSPGDLSEGDSILLDYSEYGSIDWSLSLVELKDITGNENQIVKCDSQEVVVVPESNLWNELQALIDARSEKIVILNAEIDKLKEAQTLIASINENI